MEKKTLFRVTNEKEIKITSYIIIYHRHEPRIIRRHGGRGRVILL